MPVKVFRLSLVSVCLGLFAAATGRAADTAGGKQPAVKDTAVKDTAVKDTAAEKGAANGAAAKGKDATAKGPAVKVQVSVEVKTAAAKTPVAKTPAAKTPAKQKASGGAVSYWLQVRPILQANCHGCHQPAKAGGRFVMTSFDKLLVGGESGDAAIKPGDPAGSYLIQQITPHDGKADMPKEKPALAAADIALLTRWIAQGARDDSAAHAGPQYDMQHPPIYARPAVITSIDYSPDGKLLAVAAFHEVLLVDAHSLQRVARLVGQSERIESVRFSPDGKRLAVVGGLPSRLGEVQIWDVAARKQLLSKNVTYNTLYGASWSPDGKLVAFGCGDIDDSTVRAINAQTGEQVLTQGAHSDWVRETAFSVDGSHVVSVARDMTVKLTEVATQRFVDNVTSITPGVLKGGIQAVVRHPKFDILAVAGSDGTPKIYRIFREAKRVIGDDANLVMDLFPMMGRVFSVRFSADGKRIACASSLDGNGEIVVCSFNYDTDVPADVKAVMGKVPRTRSAAENELLTKYRDQGVKLLARVTIPGSAIYTTAFDPQGKVVAAAGADGLVRLIDIEQAKVVKDFQPAPLVSSATAGVSSAATGAVVSRGLLKRTIDLVGPESLAVGTKVVGIEVRPNKIEFNGAFDYVQLLVTGKLDNGETTDITRLVRAKLGKPVIAVARNGLVQPQADGQTTLRLELNGQSASVPVSVSGMSSPQPVDFVHDVAPMLSKLGCNAGTCHGAAQGKNGFKLSLRGYDPIYDVRALTDDLAARRVNLVSPDDSLMLLKASAGVPHMGGQLTKQGEAAYAILRNWIEHGARLDVDSPRVVRITIDPQEPVVPRAGGRQQMRVLATYADGRVRDVTEEAFVDSGNTEVATVSRFGLMTAVRRGEAPVLARYEGAYAATTLTVMGDRSGFEWKQPETWSKIDELVAAKWKRMKILPSDVCSDTEFLRRAYLDLTGLPPSAEQVRAFASDKRPMHQKRAEVIDSLVGNKEFIEYWTNKWADLLQVNRKFLGPQGSIAFRQWIRSQVAANTPYDKFVYSILTAVGSNRENPASSYYKILREPTPTMENTTHLFLAVRFNCNKCHDHPFERWTQDQYYQTSAFFAQVGLKGDPAGGKATIGGTAVEGAKPLYEVVFDNKTGEVDHIRTGQVAAPKFPYPAKFKAEPSATRREQLASWITSADNQYFARSYVNRLWGYLFGVGIIEPIDDIRAGNPASNPQLLDYLTEEFIRSKFDVRHMIKLMVSSRTYQLAFTTNRWNADDRINYSHALARRLPAEVLYDTVYTAMGATSQFPGVKPGTRAAELPDSGVELPSGFLSTFGRPPRESACECERSSGLQLGPVMALISGPTIAEAIADPKNALASLVAKEKDDRKLVNEIFLRVMNRPATDREIDASLGTMKAIDADHHKLVAALAQREAAVAVLRVEQEKQRTAAMAQAQKDVDEYEKESAPRVAEAAKRHAAEIVRLEGEVKKVEAGLPAKQLAWEKKQSSPVEWIPLRPAQVTISDTYKATVLADRSVFVEEIKQPKDKKAKKATLRTPIVVNIDTGLRGITAIRLEAISDERLPGGGPGRAGGNFVLTQLLATATARGNPKQSQMLVFERPQADFNQEGFPINNVLNVNPNPNSGWAVSPATGATHWAVFQIKDAVGYEGGTRISFKLLHSFRSPEYVLGRFRISVALATKSVPLGLPEDLQAALAVPVAERDAAQQKVLSSYYRALDTDLRAANSALGEGRRPLPADPKLVQLREQLELVSRPVPPDSQLMQLREDVKMSTAQIANRRLTSAQDLAWALINSPAFLFNH